MVHHVASLALTAGFAAEAKPVACTDFAPSPDLPPLLYEPLPVARCVDLILEYSDDRIEA
jgi:hypothetical protein